MDKRDRLIDCWLGEYKSLKDEQLRRLTTRDNIFYLTIVSLGLTLTLAHRTDNILVFLVIPWLCLLLGWLHIVNDQKIVDIRAYLQGHLERKLQSLLTSERILAWEFSGPSRRPKDFISTLKRLLYFAAKLMAFFVPGALALTWFFMRFDVCSQGIFERAVFAFAIIQSCLLLLLALFLDRYLGLRNR